MQCCTDIHGAQRINPTDLSSIVPPSGQNTMREITMSTWWIGTELCADIHGSQMMHPYDFTDLTVLLCSDTGCHVRFTFLFFY